MSKSKIESLKEIREELSRSNPLSLREWLDANGRDLTAIEVLYIVVDHIDRLRDKVEGIKEINNLWDGS